MMSRLFFFFDAKENVRHGCSSPQRGAEATGKERHWLLSDRHTWRNYTRDHSARTAVKVDSRGAAERATAQYRSHVHIFLCSPPRREGIALKSVVQYTVIMTSLFSKGGGNENSTTKRKPIFLRFFNRQLWDLFGVPSARKEKKERGDRRGRKGERKRKICDRAKEGYLPPKDTPPFPNTSQPTPQCHLPLTHSRLEWSFFHACKSAVSFC